MSSPSTFAPRTEQPFLQKSALPFYRKHDVPKTLEHRHPYLSSQSSRLHIDEVTQACGETEPLARLVSQMERIEEDFTKVSEIIDHFLIGLSDPNEVAKAAEMVGEKLIQKVMKLEGKGAEEMRKVLLIIVGYYG